MDCVETDSIIYGKDHVTLTDSRTPFSDVIIDVTDVAERKLLPSRRAEDTQGQFPSTVSKASDD